MLILFKTRYIRCKEKKTPKWKKENMQGIETTIRYQCDQSQNSIANDKSKGQMYRCEIVIN